MLIVQNLMHALNTAVFLDVVNRVLSTNTVRRREHQQRQQQPSSRHGNSDFWHSADINLILWGEAENIGIENAEPENAGR